MKLGLISLALIISTGCGRKDNSDDDGSSDDGGAEDGGAEDGGAEGDGGSQDGGSEDGGSQGDGGSGDGGSTGDSVIADIQQRNGYSDGDVVTVNGVVTSPDIGSGFFMQDGSGAWTGIYVYDGYDADVVQGDAVEVTGEIIEYYDLTELDASKGSVTITGTGSLPTPAVITASDATDLEPYESVVVRVEDVTCSAEADDFGEWWVDDTFKIDNLFYELTPSVGDSFTSLTGPLNYNHDEYKLAPRDASDIVE